MSETAETAWYDELRERSRPHHLRVLLIGESVPDPGAGERRFFYAPTLTYDNLYRGVAEAVYGESGIDVGRKTDVLERLRNDGFWLTGLLRKKPRKRGFSIAPFASDSSRFRSGSLSAVSLEPLGTGARRSLSGCAGVAPNRALDVTSACGGLKRPTRHPDQAYSRTGSARPAIMSLDD